jgi:hypothetical protein
VSPLEKFLQYQQALIASVSIRGDVLGLVFLGSSAIHSRVDQYSDQDFFLIVSPGSGEAFRNNLEWLPEHQSIVLAPRETAHGLKVLYESGLVLEFAVFEDQELELSAANDYLVALDKSDIEERMAIIANRSVPAEVNPTVELELFLSLIVLGVGRARRGETIAADQHIKSYAVERLLKVIRALSPISGGRHDSLNAFRRFELDYPALGAHIAMHMLQPAEVCAKGLLHLAKTELPLSSAQQDQLSAVKTILEWS